MSKQAIARQVEETLRDASYLEVRGRVEQSVIYGRSDNILGGLEPVEFHSRMARDRLFCEVCRNGQLITVFAWLNGRVQEYRPQQDGAPLIEYGSLRTDGVGQMRFNEGFECLIGTQLHTWVGPMRRVGRIFREWIESAEQQPDQEVGGRRCHVFKHAATTCAGEPLEHTIYVDQKTFLILRWDSLHQGIFRNRRYEPIAFGDRVPEGACWEINVASPRTGRSSATDRDQ